jgi:bacterioferritin-associated ferredoxin
MDNNLNEAILDKLTKTCTCKLITRAKIKEVIKNGASTLEEVQKATGAGSGPCKGRNCFPRINELIEQSKENRY